MSILEQFHDRGEEDAFDEKKAEALEFKNLNRIEAILREVDRVQLIEGTVTETAELKKRKAIARSLVNEVLEAVRCYVLTVMELAHYRSGYRHLSEGQGYRDEVAELDQRRRTAHESLLDTLQSALRYLKQNFGELTPAEADAFEEAIKTRKQTVLPVARITLPTNIFLPSSVGINNRQAVAEWAERVVEEMNWRDRLYK